MSAFSFLTPLNNPSSSPSFSQYQLLPSAVVHDVVEFVPTYCSHFRSWSWQVQFQSFFDAMALVRRIWPSFKSFSVTIIDWSTLASSSASCASFFSRFPLFFSAFSSCSFILLFSSSASLSFLSFNSFSRFSFSFQMFIRPCAVVTAARMAWVIDVMWAPPIDRTKSLPLLKPRIVESPNRLRSFVTVFLLSERLLSTAAFPFWREQHVFTTFLMYSYRREPDGVFNSKTFAK